MSDNHFDLPDDFDPANNLIHAHLLSAITMANLIPPMQAIASVLVNQFQEGSDEENDEV